MSTSPVVQPTPVVPVPPHQREIYIYSHSGLFYWWPVWAVGFLMAVLTFFDGHRLAVVPAGTEARAETGQQEKLVVPTGKNLPRNQQGEVENPHLKIAHTKNLGVIFETVLLLIIVISNVPLRGLWSVTIVLLVVLLVVIFALAGWWETILEKLSYLDVRINMGGYLFLSTLLLIIWAATVFIFDHRTYVAINPGQVRVCLAVGAGETVYDTTGMTFQKQQNDLFRHWIVGLGSGDLIIHRSNTNQEIDMPNVLFIGQKVREIEQLIKERQVV
jgi:hypothetical protein